MTFTNENFVSVLRRFGVLWDSAQKGGKTFGDGTN